MNRDQAKILRTFSPSAYRAGMAYEDALQAGQAAGLSEAEAREVIEAWNVWYQSTPHPFSFDQARAAMERRATGEAWEPPTAGKPNTS